MLMFKKAKPSRWYQGLKHAEQVAKREGVAGLIQSVQTKEYADTGEFEQGVHDYIDHYTKNAHIGGPCHGG